MLAEKVAGLATCVSRLVFHLFARYFRVRPQAAIASIRAQLGEAAATQVQGLCDEAGMSTGDFAAWLKVQTLDGGCILRLPGAMMMAFARRRCPITAAQANLLHPAGGAVVAVPHYGAFIPAVIAIALAAPPRRPVVIFYDPPARAEANSAFDAVAGRIIPTLRADIRICHNDAGGLAQALKTLRAGGSVILLPDVCRDASQGIALPFLGRHFVALTGVGRLVRRTGATLVVALPGSDPVTPGLRILGAAPDERATASARVEGPALDTMLDYRTARWLFATLEAGIGRSRIFWRYALTYAAPFGLGPHDSATLMTLIRHDPLLRCHAATVIHFSDGSDPVPDAAP